MTFPQIVMAYEFIGKQIGSDEKDEDRQGNIDALGMVLNAKTNSTGRNKFDVKEIFGG